MSGTRTLSPGRAAALRARLSDPEYVARAVDRIAERAAVDLLSLRARGEDLPESFEEAPTC